MKPYFGMTGGWLTFWVSVACSTDMALFGYDQGVFGGVNVTRDYLDTLKLSPTGTTLSTITAIYDIGSFLGAVLAFDLGERLGRKKTILLGSAIMTIGCILQCSAYSVAQMIVARIIAGIGNGLNTATAPVWQAETSKANMRGKLVVIEMICNIAGFSLSNWITYGFSFLNGGVTWRFPIAFQMIFIFVLFATVPWLPESPRWLVSHGRLQEADQIIADLEDLPIDDPYVLTQSKEIQYAAQQERENSIPLSQLGADLWARFAALVTRKPKPTPRPGDVHVVRRLLLGAGTQAMQQFSGINVLSYYFPTVLTQSVNLSENLARLLAACNSVSYLIFGSLAIPVVERSGRRFLMLLGASGQCLCYLVVTVLLYFNEDPSYKNQKKVAEASIAFFFLYYVFFGFGWQGVPWLYPTEINSLGMRTRGAAIGTATNWIVNFMVVEITPPGIRTLGWKFYIIWTIFNFSFIPIVYFLYPETAGRSLEDLDRYFANDPPVLVFRDKEAIGRRRPQKFVDIEQTEIRRNSSIVSAQVASAREKGLANEKKADESEKGSENEVATEHVEVRKAL